MATLSELRSHVRTQMDVTNLELTDAELNRYLREAFERTVAYSNEWPFYEKLWLIFLTAGQKTMTLPTDIEESTVVSLYDTSNDFRLRMIQFSEAETYGLERSAFSATHPIFFSVWADTIYLWPEVTYASTKEYRLRGYRKPTAWSDEASSEPDIDERLHLSLTHYATALAYAQQEDQELERTYMERWQKDVEAIAFRIMEPMRARPVIMGPNVFGHIGYRGVPYPSWTIDVP